MARFHAESFRQAKNYAPIVMRQLVCGETGILKIHSVRQFDFLMRKLRFKLIRRCPKRMPPGGYQLFYQRDIIVVRLKTKGDAGGYRQNQPHASAGLTDGKGFDWQNDKAKFSKSGRIAPKVITHPDNFKNRDFQGNPQRFVLIEGSQYSEKEFQDRTDAWAKRTHFPCPLDWDDSGAAGLSLSVPVPLS